MNIQIDKQNIYYYMATDEEDVSSIVFEVQSDNMEQLKRHISEIGYKTTFKNCNKSYLQINEIEKIRIFANEYINETTQETEIGIFLFVSDNKDCIFIGYYKDINLTDTDVLLNKFIEWLNNNTKKILITKGEFV